MSVIRPCRDLERESILEIVNSAAEAYRGVIPADRWHEPYMPSDELDRELSAGVAFWGYETDGVLVGIIGIQRVRDVELIRHAYVLPGSSDAASVVHCSSISSASVHSAYWSAHGQPRSGRSASIAVTASSWSRRSDRPHC